MPYAVRRYSVTSIEGLALLRIWQKSMSAFWREGRPSGRTADGLALAVISAVAIIAVFTFRDYGLGWDDYVHAEYGGLLLKLY